MAHSFLISKNEDQTYSILIKPNVKNKDYLDPKKEIPSEIMQKGSYKMVKKTGILITISADKKTLVSVERQVIVSRDAEVLNKKEDLSSKIGSILIDDGFKKHTFYDKQRNQNRDIYTMPYLGEPISQEWSKLNPTQKKEFALALIDDVLDNEKNDIKPDNMLISPNKDRIHVIDFSKKIFMFTPGTEGHKPHKGNYDQSSPDQQKEARIFSLAIILWELQNSRFQYKLDFFATYKANKLTSTDITQQIRSSQELHPILKSPFFNTILKAYECRLTKDQLKQACENLF